MKRIICLMLAVLMMVSLAACGGDDNEGKGSVESQNETLVKANPVNVCDGGLVPGMAEADARAFMKDELGLSEEKYDVNGERYTNVLYLLENPENLGETKMYLSFDEGKLYLISMYFDNADKDAAIEVVKERFGDDFTQERDDDLVKYNWQFDDASVSAMVDAIDENDTLSLYINLYEI